jgi:hypothetical protein
MRVSRPILAWWMICGSAFAEVVVLKDGRAVAGLHHLEQLPHQLRAVTADDITIYFNLEQVDRETTVRLNREIGPPPGSSQPQPTPAPPARRAPPRGGAFSAGASRVVAEAPVLEPLSAEGSAVEQAWRWRATELQRSVDYRERELREEEARLREILVAESVGAYTVDGALVRQRIELALSRLQELHEERSQLEDEARRAGVPPGWLRVD